MGGQSPWNDVIITELIQLWSEGRSGAEIARRLNVSRNSVIGKAHRLSFPCALPRSDIARGNGSTAATIKCRGNYQHCPV
jgi:GcrA cell cycle regulator